MTTSAVPAEIASTPFEMAILEETHAAVTVFAGHSFGSPATRPTSRARFDVEMSEMTVPKISRSTSPGSMAVLASSPETAMAPNSYAIRPSNPVWDLRNGVLAPSTTTTGRPPRGLDLIVLSFRRETRPQAGRKTKRPGNPEPGLPFRAPRSVRAEVGYGGKRRPRYVLGRLAVPCGPPQYGPRSTRFSRAERI